MIFRRMVADNKLLYIKLIDNLLNYSHIKMHVLTFVSQNKLLSLYETILLISVYFLKIF